MPATPAARPSRPSSQLMALVIPTSQTTVASRLRLSGRAIGPAEAVNQGRSIAPIRTPWLHTAQATATCPASRGQGERAKRSSARPIRKNRANGQGAPDQLILGRRQQAETADGPDHRQGQRKTQHHGNAPQSHHGGDVLLALIRLVGPPEAKPHPAHLGHQHQGGHRSQKKADRGDRNRACQEVHAGSGKETIPRSEGVSPILGSLQPFNQAPPRPIREPGPSLTPEPAACCRRRGGSAHREQPPARGNADESHHPQD